jgi:hypothetical protein
LTRSAQQSGHALQSWFIIAAFAVLGLAFLFGALNTFREESVAAEGYGPPSLAYPKTVFVVCESIDRCDGLRHTLSRSGVEAIFTTDQSRASGSLEPWAASWSIPIESVRKQHPQAMARAILTSEHHVVVAVSDDAGIDELLDGLGVDAPPPIDRADDDLLVVSVAVEDEATLLHLKY